MKPAHAENPEPLTREEAFEEAIKMAVARRPALLKMVTPDHCFARRWRDETGPCDVAHECAVSEECHRTWRDATDMQRQLVPRVQDVPVVPPHEPPPMPAVAAVTPPRRGHAGARPVDKAIDHFVRALGDPSVLPPGWQPRNLDKEHRRHGRMVLSQTPSYISVYIDNVMRLRFDTNAAGHANIAIVDDLVPCARKILGSVGKIPKGSQKKLKPCTHRVSVGFHEENFEDVLDELATALVKTYHLEGTG